MSDRFHSLYQLVPLRGEGNRLFASSFLFLDCAGVLYRGTSMAASCKHVGDKSHCWLAISSFQPWQAVRYLVFGATSNAQHFVRKSYIT
jgi:hypothetical protein